MHYIVCGTQRSVKWYIVKLGVTQPLFTCCKSIKETPEQCLKSGNSLCTKWDLIARFGEQSEKENQHERVSWRKLSSRPQTSVCWQVEVGWNCWKLLKIWKKIKKKTLVNHDTLMRKVYKKKQQHTTCHTTCFSLLPVKIW